MRYVPLLLTILLLPGCGGQRDTATIVSRTQALADVVPKEMLVTHVYDSVTDIVNPDHDENISAMIEVSILSGDDQGKDFVYPFDEWNVGHKPPQVGERVVLAPADWVRLDPDSHGKPFDEVNDKH